jgi:glycerol-3-phosphate dehydrogenase (NAD(P)+)
MNVSALGAGAWGTALAVALASRHRVTLWGRDAAQLARMRDQRRNLRYLPEIELPAALALDADLESACKAAELLLLAVPAAGLRELCVQLRAAEIGTPLVWLCKGFEQSSGLLPHQVVEETLGASRAECGALSGPSFALEVARGLPCALTLAAKDQAFARRAALSLHGGRIRVYYSGDLTGVEIGGAVKNVLAIAVGISDGMGLGQNARAALITRGLAEISRLGIALGAQPETIMGLTGAGDLILTATGDLSRNRRVGLELARGTPLMEILAALGHVAEGVHSAKEVQALAQRMQVEMPITRAVNAVLDGRASAGAALDALLARDPREEV